MEPVEIDDDDVTAFLVESYENLNHIEQDIIDLEKNFTKLESATEFHSGVSLTDGEALGRIYRSIHSIKGNCGFLPFPKLESVAHAGESLLGFIRNRLQNQAGRVSISSSVVSALLQTVDTIRQILAQIESTGHEGDSDYSVLLSSLTKLEEAPEFHSGVSLTQLQQTEPEKSLPQPPNQILSTPAETSSDEAMLLLGTEGAAPSAKSSIRVDVDLLDRVMNLVGELVLARNQVMQFSTTLKDSAFASTCQRLNSITTELQEEVMKTRMQPINIIWQKFGRLTRDLAIAYGKQVQIDMEGTQTELDRNIIEAIKDPLTHLVRNCIDHGIETPDQRLAQGKPATGRMLLRAFHESGKVHIEISDDGSGLDLQRLKHKAQQLGLIAATEAAAMSDAEAVNLIFLPGFSTAERVTNLSGRGVGMDVVKSHIEKIQGTVEVQSQLGQGTTFKIKIPLTLAIIPALLILSGGDRYAIPQANLQELVRLEGQAQSSIETLYDVPVFRLRGKLLPLVYLHQQLQIQNSTTDEEVTNIVVIQADDFRFGLVVDAIEDTQDIVVKPLGKQLKNISTFAGATILGDGKVALIIDAIELAKHAGVLSQIQQPMMNTAIAEEDDQQMILLFEGLQDTRMGILLTDAARLEEFPRSTIEKVGNQYVVQYRDEILSLIDLKEVFFAEQKLTLDNSPTDENLQVVVTSEQACHVGLVVERIIDIVEESLTIKGTATRPGVLFFTVVQGKITEILDVESVVRIANPYFFQLSSSGANT